MHTNAPKINGNSQNPKPIKNFFLDNYVCSSTSEWNKGRVAAAGPGQLG